MPYPDDFNGAACDAMWGDDAPEDPSLTEYRADMLAACKAAEVAMQAALTSLRQAVGAYDEVKRIVEDFDLVGWPFREDPHWMPGQLEDLLCITDAEAKLRDWRARR